MWLSSRSGDSSFQDCTIIIFTPSWLHRIVGASYYAIVTFFFTSDASQESRVRIRLFDIESNYYIRARYIFISLAINKARLFQAFTHQTRYIYIYIYINTISRHIIMCTVDDITMRPSSSNRCRLFSIFVMDRIQKFSPGKNNLAFWKISLRLARVCAIWYILRFGVIALIARNDRIVRLIVGFRIMAAGNTGVEIRSLKWRV